MKPKKVVVISDLHCGHHAGLTHPDFDSVPSESNETLLGLYRSRRIKWKWFIKTIGDISPNILIVNGDAVDGKGDRSGSTELITADRQEQVDMAIAAIDACNAKQVFLTFGTPYHSGTLEDWEEGVLKGVKHGKKIGSHDWLDVNGLVLDYRHHVSSSSVPYGKATPISKERDWNLHWADSDYGFPKSDVVIRSHVHNFSYAGGRGWLAMTTPALQGLGTKFGARRMSGTVDYGFISFEIRSKGDWTWQYHLLQNSKQFPIKA